MAEILVVGSKVKAFVKKDKVKMQMSGDYLKALSKKVEDMVKESMMRAKGNKRKTLRPVDL